jgi:hypothetical protein
MGRLRDTHNAVWDSLKAKTVLPASVPKADRFKSKLERTYALQYLTPLVHAGQLKDWKYEALKFRLADGSWFTPDFAVVLLNGAHEIHELKGWMREAARVRFLVARELFPSYRWRMIEKKAGAWTERPL